MWKNISIALVLIATCIFSGCKLDVDDDEKLPGDKFWNDGTPENAEAFMLSIYQCLRTATVSNGFFLYSGDLRCAPIANYTSKDKIYTLLSNNMAAYQGHFDSKEEGKSTTCGAIYNWKNMYRVVQSANIMLEEIGNIKGLSSEELAGYKAECVFLRSLAYFFMVRLFGDVPYYTEGYAAKPLPRTPMVTVLKNLLVDLQTVLDNDPEQKALPWKKGTNNLRANRGATLMLMMHINMWLACFDNANSTVYYSAVKRLAEIDSWIDGTYYTLLSIEQMSNLFRGNSSEGVFEIAQNITAGEVFDTDNMWTSKVVYECLTKSAPEMNYSKAFLKELYPMEVDDRRKNIWFANLGYDDFGEIIVSSSSSSSSVAREIEVVKMLNIDQYQSKVIPNSGNYIVFRLADAILLYAEALDKLGEAATALIEVNRIRDRAEAIPFDETVKLADAIYWERVRELMGEGQYFYDLVRTERLCDPDSSTFSDGTGYREKRANFIQGAWTWPIYKGALAVNPYISKNLYWE